ncbi:MAG: 16S rRNA (adenine(1518)-N(6)/adenine(1519)-N(6))-dimethyltransferase RsmA [Candidatus Dojkabacteria bacterium]
MIKHNFKKFYGQNFLKNTRFAERLIAGLELKAGETVIEIGPGDGMVTNLLLQKDAKVICIEVDYDLIPNLIKRFGDNPNFHIVHQDVLEANFDEILKKFEAGIKFKVVGSLPYNISKPIINKLINYKIGTDKDKQLAAGKSQLISMSFIVQDEVAKDYVASAPKATFLSNYVRLFCDVRKFESIPAQQFYPMPKVNGGIVYFEFRNEPKKNFEEIRKFLRIGFTSPRKTLARNLKNSNKWKSEDIDKAFVELGLGEKVRPAEIDTEMWMKLFETLNSNI